MIVESTSMIVPATIVPATTDLLLLLCRSVRWQGSLFTPLLALRLSARE